MKKEIIRKFAAIAACFAVCAGTSCGKVERPDDKENVTVSGNDSATADASATTADGSSENQSELITIPVTTDENTSQAATSAGTEELPVSGQPAEDTSAAIHLRQHPEPLLHHRQLPVQARHRLLPELLQVHRLRVLPLPSMR